MKNLAKIFMAVVLLAGITSCVQDTTVDEGIFQPTTEVTISVEDANRTALGAKTDEGTYPVYWSTGDKISVNGVASKPLAEIEEGAVKGLFQIEGTIDSPYKVSYPATAEAGQVLFAAQQSYVAGTFSQGAAAMYGESETLAIQMQHAAGVLQFPIKAAEGAEVVLKKVVVTNPNGKLAGLYNAALVEGELTLTPDASAINTISYNCGDLALSTEPVKLHIAIPAGEYEELKVSLVATNGQVMNFKVTAVGEMKVKAGIVREFNKTTHITFSGNDASFQITDSESLMKFAEMCANGAFAYSSAKVMNNFTFDSATYTWAPVTGFVDGLEFDGGDFTITGLPDALFATAVGTIRNLTLDSTIEKGVTTKAGFGIFANRFQGEINNCTAKGSIAITSSTQDWAAIGGFVGWANGGITFVDSTNEAAVSVDNSAKRTYIAGFLGSNYPGAFLAANNPMIFTNCHNIGDITSKENGSNRRGMGGFVGCQYTSEATNIISIDGCSNQGDVIQKAVASDNHIAGFIGSDMGVASISNSYNTGSIAIQGTQTATGNNYSIGGFVGYQTNTLTLTNCVSGATINQDGTFTNDEDCTISIATAPGGVRVGGLVGYANTGAGTSFTGCRNYATIAATGNHKNLYIGGIAADCIIEGAEITNCHNYGALSLANEASAACVVGGIAGEITKAAGKIDGCTNNVNLTLGGKAGTNYYAGGIVGLATAQVLNVTNNNDITFEGTATTAYYIGGVAGSIQTVNVFNLKNAGDLTYQGSLTTGKQHSKNLCAVDAPSIAGVVAWLGKSGNEVFVADSLVSTGSIHLLPTAGTTKSDSFCHAGVIGVSNNYNIKRAYFKKNAQGVAPSINITSNPTSYNSTNEGEEILGGIVAAPFATKVGADIENCYNEGIINLNSPVMQNQHNMRIAGIAAHANQRGANGVIKNCVNAGQIIFGTDHMAGAKSMDAGGISGNANCNFEGCINRGTITFKNLAAPANYSTKNVWYSAGIGGIAGITSGKLVRCEDHGSIIAEANSLNPRTSSSWYAFGGLVGRSSAGCDLVECVAKGSIEVDAASAMYDGIFHAGGVVGNIYGKATSAYIVKDCVVEANVSAPAHTRIGLVTGTPYATVATMYTPVADTDYPVTGCKIDGSLVRSGKEVSDVTESNFHEVIYSDTPSVETWVPVVGDDGVTRYHGNYGVKTTGGDSTDDLG